MLQFWFKSDIINEHFTGYGKTCIHFFAHPQRISLNIDRPINVPDRSCRETFLVQYNLPCHRFGDNQRKERFVYTSERLSRTIHIEAAHALFHPAT